MKRPSFSFLFTALLLFFTIHLDAQWDRQYPLPKLEDVLDIDVSSDGYGFAVGPNDLLLRSQAGNNQWDLLPGFGEGWRFEAVDYLEGSGGSVAAAGGAGLILTVDKGDHWNEVAGAPTGINTVRIFSPTHIIVASANDVSEWDNGIWTNLNVQPAAGLTGAFILDDQTMWAYTFATNPTIYYTTNGGTNWSTNADVPKVDVLKFFDAQNGIALNGRDVYKSTNGGQAWTLLSSNSLKNSAYDFAFGSTSSILVAATLNAKPNISTDGGLNWTAITTPLVNQRSHSVAAISDTEFFVGNDLTGVMHSTDGGNTWVETCGPTRNLIQDVYFVNRTTGFAIGQKGMILRTEDAGKHWEDISFGTRSHLCIHGLNLNDLWIGTNQRILHSVNSGDTWTESTLFPAGNINDVLAISHDRILAASTTGIIYLSKNAGMTWDSVYSSGLQMRSLARIDDQQYMATGFNGVIVRSDDQGQTWHAVTIPEPGLQYEQTFFLNGEGWLITSSFKRSMWHTTDGGNTWDTLGLPIDRFWDGLYFITKDTGVIVGRSTTEGRAYLTFDGGHHWQPGYITSYPLYGATGSPNPNGTAWIFGYGSDIENLLYCNSLPVIANFKGDLFPCEQDTVAYTITSQNVDEYIWHFPPGWQIIGNANNDSIEVIVGSNAGSITVKGTNTCGETGQLSFSSGPHHLPFLSSITGNDSPCLGEVVTYSAVEEAVDHFIWSVPADWTILGNPDLQAITVQVGSSDGEIALTGTNTCGTSGHVLFFVTPRPLPTITFVSGPLSPCEGDTVIYVFNSEPGNAFTLSTQGLNDWKLLSSQIPNTIKVVAGSIPGTLQVTTWNDCGFSVPLDLQLTPLPVPDVSLSVNGTILSTSTTGASYQWIYNSVPINGAVNDTFVALLTGAYTVKVTFVNGCSAVSGPAEVFVSATHDPAILPLQVYPVPTDNELFTSGIIGDYTFSIFDLLGKKIKWGEAHQNKIQVGELSKGMYIMKVEKDGRHYLAKFIRQ